MLPKQAAIYCRISKDKAGLSLGVARQQEDCRRLAERLGWWVGREYVDNDTSAYSGKPRPQYQAMMADIRTGRIDGILCYDVDRLTRAPKELEDIIDLADRHGIALAVVGGEYDLATADGRFNARLAGALAKRESEKMSRRIQREVAQRAEAGRPHGFPPYGWRREGGRNVIEPEQAKIVEEIIDRILASESMAGIARDLQLRGVPPVRQYKKAGDGTKVETTWSRPMVRQLALKASNAGLRVHRGEVIGQGDWEPIIPRAKYERVKAYLTDPTRRISTTNNYRHLLSGIARCGKCGGLMRVMSWNRKSTYVCANCFGVRRVMEPVDSLVIRITKERLNMPDALRAFAPPDDSHLYEEADDIERQIKEVIEDHLSGKLKRAEYLYMLDRLYGRLDKVKEQMRQSWPDVRNLIRPDLVWDELPLERKRAIITLLFDITILPARAPGVRFDPATVVVTAKGARPPAAPGAHPPTGGPSSPSS